MRKLYTHTHAAVVFSFGEVTLCFLCELKLIYNCKETKNHIIFIIYFQTELNAVCLSLRLADYDVVVTTYSLVSKEIPVQKEEADKPTKDSSDVVSNIYFRYTATVLTTAVISINAVA